MSTAATTGAITAAIAAAEKRKKEAEEEEKLTPYKTDDLDGWEFKIVRSATGKFRNRAAVEKLRQEEAQAGWEMLEKFDDNRIRFKRRVENRSRDAHLDLDPYRASVGFGAKISVVIGVLNLLAGVALLLFMNSRSGLQIQTPIIIAAVAVLIGVLAVVLRLKKG